MKAHSELIHNESENQFELHIGEQIAFVEYYRDGNKIHLTHTEVPQSLQGHGVGSELTEKTFQYIRNNNLVLIPLCSFVAHYVNNHPQWHSILSEGYQM